MRLAGQPERLGELGVAEILGRVAAEQGEWRLRAQFVPARLELQRDPEVARRRKHVNHLPIDTQTTVAGRERPHQGADGVFE